MICPLPKGILVYGQWYSWMLKRLHQPERVILKGFPKGQLRERSIGVQTEGQDLERLVELLGGLVLVWACGIESRQATVVLPCLQASFEDLRALTGGSRPPILRMHPDNAREFPPPATRTYLSKQGVKKLAVYAANH